MHERATASGNGHPTEFDPLPDARALTLANAFLRFSGHSARAEGGDRKPLTLWSWRQEFFSWDGSVYQKLLPERFASDVSRFLDLQRVAKKVRGGLDTEAVDATPKLVAEIVRKIALLCQANVRQMPAWLDDHRPPAENVIAFRNGWIDVAEYLMDRQGIQNPPTAHWFSEHVIPYEYDSSPGYNCPRWLAFLDEVFKSEEPKETAECVTLLQQWFGYCLTPDNRHQNIMWFWGPPGTGKSVTAGILRDVLGEQACASPTLTSLGDQFGLEGLIGKSAAVIPDAHLGWKADSIEVVNTIKSITGGDPMDVRRKFLRPISGAKLPIRFTIGINLLPSLRDDSSAIRRRMLVLPFEHIHDGKDGHPEPDRTLAETLRRELPEIVKWSLHGLRSLRLQGGFRQPACADWIVSDMCRMGSPVLCFVEDRCIRVADELWTGTTSLYEAYLKYAGTTGRGKETSIEQFGSALKGMGFRKFRPREGEERINAYRGIMLQTEVPT